MARYISFILNSGAKIKDYSKPQTIYFRYRRKNVDFIRSTGFSVKHNPNPSKSDWDETHRKVKDRTNIVDRHYINRHLRELESHFSAFVDHNREKGIIPSKKEVETHYKAFFSDLSDSEINNSQKITDFIQEYSERKGIVNNRSKGTIRNYIKLKNKLEDFQKKKKNSLMFDDIDLKWYNTFVIWLEDKGYKPNYIGDLIKNIKLFMSIANEEGITTNQVHNNRSFAKPSEEVHDIYLTEKEIDKIYNLDLTEYESLDIVRDLFLIGCYTGLRVSDYTKLKVSNIKTINEVKFLEVLPKKTEKTGKKVLIPLKFEAFEILKKYEFNMPSRTGEHINRNIQSICRRAKINDLVENETKSLMVKKFTRVKSHTGRRSFCTNAYLNGLSTIDIMAISGHVTESAFLRYIKVTPTERAERMADNNFFNKSYSSSLKAI